MGVDENGNAVGLFERGDGICLIQPPLIT
jgi:hypothetical protein